MTVKVAMWWHAGVEGQREETCGGCTGMKPKVGEIGKTRHILKRCEYGSWLVWWEKGRDWADKGTDKSHQKLCRYMNCKDMKGKQTEALEREKREEAGGRRSSGSWGWKTLQTSETQNPQCLGTASSLCFRQGERDSTVLT